MFCNKCGNRLEDNSISCDKCGYVFVYNAVGNPVINKTVDKIDASNHNGKLFAGLAIGLVLGAGIMFGVTRNTENNSSDNGNATTAVADAGPETEAIVDTTAVAEGGADSTAPGAIEGGADSTAQDSMDMVTDNSGTVGSDGQPAEDSTAIIEDSTAMAEDSTIAEEKNTEVAEGSSDSVKPEQSEEPSQDSSFVGELVKYMDMAEAGKIYSVITGSMGYAPDEISVISQVGANCIMISLAGVQFAMTIDETVTSIANADYIMYEAGDVLLTKHDVVY